MKKIISILITITMWLSLFPVIHAEEAKETVWSFGSETDISTDVSALDNPVIKDAAQYDNSLGAVKCYGGNDLTLTLSNPIEISENAKITVEADIAYSKESGGTGLGLSIVKHGAMLHNASIHVESELNKGTKMELTF